MSFGSQAGFDAVVVGAGPAGLFAALECAKSSAAGRIALVDAGPDLHNRSKAVAGLSPWSGFGGAGFFIGGRLAMDGIGPSSVPSHVPPAQANLRLDTIRGALHRWGVSGQLLEKPPDAVKELAARARKGGLQLHVNYPAIHLSVAEREHVLRHISGELTAQSVELLFESRSEALEPDDAGWHLLISGRNGTRDIQTARVVLAPGRTGAGWLARMLKSLGAAVDERPSIGVRLEVPSEQLDALTDITPDPRFSMSSPAGDYRTYACAKGGYVTVIEEDGLARISLRPSAQAPSGRTSVSILWGPAEAAVIPARLSPSVTFLDHVLQGGQAVTSKPSFQTDVVPWNDLRPELPDAFWSGFDEFMRRLGHIAPGIQETEALVYSPAIERVWQYAVAGDGSIDVPGIFLAGDGAGVSQGAMAAAISGLVAGHGAATSL